MGVKDKEYRARMSGMVYALKIVKESGVETLEKEIRFRNATFMPLEISQEKMLEIEDFLAERVMATMMPTMMLVLHDSFGFGKERLIRYKKAFLKRCEMLSSLDPLGEPYERIRDYVEELEKYGIEFDMAKIEDVERTNNENRKRYAELEYVLDFLNRRGFGEAAEALRKHSQ